MPLYEYECKKCKHRFDLIQKVSDPPASKCPKCGGRKIEKLISASGLQFKGSGWYVNDYARKGKSEKSESSAPKNGSSKPSESPKGSGSSSSSTTNK
jgi:putative FmdB family regulatory protein